MRRVAAVAFLALALPTSAFAHATMQRSTPPVQGRIEVAPSRIVLHFDQSVLANPRSIQVRTATGRLVSGRAQNAPDHRLVLARLRPLARGAYTVRWSAVSADGHVASGVFTFGLGVAAPPPTEAFGASGPTWSDDLVRWALFASLALLLGGLGFRLVVLGRAPLPDRVRRRLTIMTAIGVVATLEAGIVGFILRAEDALQLPFGRLMYGDLSPLANDTRFGQAFVVMTLGYALVSALLFLAWLTDLDRLLWVAFALALAFASGLSLSGHSGVEPNSTWLSELADWVHLCAAALWAGGLLTMAVAVWPVAPELRRTAFVRFSRLAPILISLLLAAGLFLSIERLPAVSDLWEASYGRVLLVKLSLVCVALIWGAFHHFFVRPGIERDGGGGRVRRSLVGESLVGMAVLLAAAVLVNSAPPPRAAPTGGEAVRVGR